MCTTIGSDWLTLVTIYLKMVKSDQSAIMTRLIHIACAPTASAVLNYLKEL